MSPSALLVLCMVLPLGGMDADYRMPSGERVPGARLSDLPGMNAQTERVRAAVQKTYSIDIGRIPVHVVSIEDIRTLIKQVGGAIGGNWHLFGFAYQGHVFVRRSLGGIADEILTHECLHASSERFSGEAHARGIARLVEGTTQFLALRALAARPHSDELKSERNKLYQGSTKLAEQLADLIGMDVLANAYFHEGFVSLCQRVDAATHGRHRLEKAALLLERGDEAAAMKLLTAQ